MRPVYFPFLCRKIALAPGHCLYRQDTRSTSTTQKTFYC